MCVCVCLCACVFIYLCVYVNLIGYFHNSSASNYIAIVSNGVTSLVLNLAQCCLQMVSTIATQNTRTFKAVYILSINLIFCFNH